MPHSLTLGQLESLGIAHGLLLIIDHQSAGHHDQNTTLLVGRLHIGGGDLVLDLLERKRLSLDQPLVVRNAAESLTTSFSAMAEAP